MPGFKGKNIRSGDLSEELGSLLLQYVSLVAPIPRTEDAGIDILATLIRDFDRYNYIVEDSFFVQIKSSSVSSITYKDDQVKWLTELQLPFFIASVDKKTSTIKLNSTHHLSDALVMQPNRNEITFKLHDDDYDCSDTSPSVIIPTGHHVISWSIDRLQNEKTFPEQFYRVLKAHITLNKKSIETRRVGVVELIQWEPEEEPIIVGIKSKPTENDKRDNEIIAPYFNSLLRNLTNGEDLFTTRSLYRLLDKILEQQGHFTELDGKKVLKPFDAKPGKLK